MKDGSLKKANECVRLAVTMGISTAEFRSHPRSDGILAGFNNVNGFYQRKIPLPVGLF